MRPFLAKRLGIDQFMSPRHIEAFEASIRAKQYIEDNMRIIGEMTREEVQHYAALYDYFTDVRIWFKQLTRGL